MTVSTDFDTPDMPAGALLNNGCDSQSSMIPWKNKFRHR